MKDFEDSDKLDELSEDEKREQFTEAMAKIKKAARGMKESMDEIMDFFETVKSNDSKIPDVNDILRGIIEDGFKEFEANEDNEDVQIPI